MLDVQRHSKTVLNVNKPVQKIVLNPWAWKFTVWEFHFYQPTRIRRNLYYECKRQNVTHKTNGSNLFINYFNYPRHFPPQLRVHTHHALEPANCTRYASIVRLQRGQIYLLITLITRDTFRRNCASTLIMPSNRLIAPDTLP